MTSIEAQGELIPIAERDGIQTVNARELHAFLGVGKDFSTWIKGRIEQYNFLENRDFICSPVLGSKHGGHNAIDYHLTLDMAKELAMVERTDKGRQARQYFIECERRAKAAAAEPSGLMQALDNPDVLRSTLLMYTERVIALEETVEQQRPKVEALKRIAEAEGSLSITETAKALQVQPKQLFAYLSQHGWIYRRPGGSIWLGYQARVASGDLEHKVTTILRGDGTEKVCEQVRVTIFCAAHAPSKRSLVGDSGAPAMLALLASRRTA